MRAIPQIRSVMTESPVSVGIDEPLRVAQDLMIDHEIRHLPVLDGDELRGVVSDRDLAAVDNLAQAGDLSERLRVRDVCTLDYYAVSPDTPLRVALREMAERRIGSVIVTDAGTVVGLFTATDACRCFAEHLGD